MNHRQLLDHLAAKRMVQALDFEVSRLVSTAMAYDWDSATITSRLMSRWSNAIDAADAELPASYRNKVIVAIATVLHKYGVADADITARAIDAIDELNREVVLSDGFASRSDIFKKELAEPPVPLKRRPAWQDSMTFFRAHDVIAIALNGRFHAAYVHEIHGINESPIIEFYEGTFDHRPAPEEVIHLRAEARQYGDQPKWMERFMVSGLTYNPDPAHQIHLIATGIEPAPSNDHLATSTGLYEVTDIMDLQETMREMFA